ncbi:MAG TPA: class I SAM-dependent methyltransferase [Streptosporangiaceae bacterium]|nr:class I SAM-dependent methyltransferase [Streptosporangiaceae bacterium]
MATLPPQQPLRFEGESHRARDMAQSFGSDPERYDRARPSYPAALVERVVAASPGREVLDVGCGTGIVARQFQAAGCSVLGVEPDTRMAGQARQRGLDVEVATFEDWDPAGRAFDAVVAGQAWHWIDPIAGAAKAARALRGGGRLAVFWNAFQPPPDLAEAFGAVFRRVLPDSPLSQRPAAGAAMYAGICARAADAIRETSAFGGPEQWEFEWDRPYTRDEWLEQVPTSGFAARLQPETMKQILAGVGAAIDAAGGGFTAHYTTVAVTAARTGAADPA